MKSILSASLTVIFAVLLISSCSKNQEQGAKVSSQVQEAKAPAQEQTKKVSGISFSEAMQQQNVNPEKAFTLQREGAVVRLQIVPDFSNCVDCKRINILRNATGLTKNKLVVGRIPMKTRQFEDTVPDGKPYYYWVRVYLDDGTPKGTEMTFGPTRVEGDAQNPGAYANLFKDYPCNVTRTYTTATIKWNFPNAKYTRIAVYRNTSSNMSNRKVIAETMEISHQITDQLPDPDANYWYWIEAALENGKIINQGPIKAEDASQ